MSAYRIIVDAHDFIGAWVSKRTGELHAWYRGMGTAVGVSRDGKLVAGVTYVGYNGANVWMGVAAERGHAWLNRATLFAFFHYPFIQLKVRRVSALVDESNARSRRLVEDLGFALESRLANAASDGRDLLIYMMRREECRWIRNTRFRNEREQASSTGRAAHGR